MGRISFADCHRIEDLVMQTADVGYENELIGR